MAEHTGDIEEYPFNHKYRGQALIFIHTNFDKPEVPRRKGTDHDERKMRELFKVLDFKVRVYRDLSDVLIMEKLKKAAECKYNAQSDCLVCVFSTHGGQLSIRDAKRGFLMWKDCIYPSRGEPIFVENILDIFNKKKCPSLAGKPKLFFIQACRSRHEEYELRYDMGFQSIRHRRGDPGGDNSNPPDELDESGNLRQQKPMKRQESNVDPIDDLAEAASHVTTKESKGEQLNPLAGGGDNLPTDCAEFVDLYKDWTDDEDEVLDDDELELEDEDPNPGDDQTDVKHKDDSGDVSPPMPVELTPLVCPEDCLVMYPVMPGRAAFRNPTEGSWMLHFLHRNIDMLLENSRLLPYLTKVCGDMGKKDFKPSDLNPTPIILVVTKVAAVIVHKLSNDVRIVPKPKYHMASWMKKIKKSLSHIKFR